MTCLQDIATAEGNVARAHAGAVAARKQCERLTIGMTKMEADAAQSAEEATNCESEFKVPASCASFSIISEQSLGPVILLAVEYSHRTTGLG